MKNILAGLTMAIGAVLALSSSMTPVRAAVVYTVIDLGTLGGSTSQAVAINTAGQIVGNSATADGHKHAFLYEKGTMKDLGTLSGFTESSAHSINDSGTIVGDVFKHGYAVAGTTPFVQSGASMTQLVTLGGKGGTARGVNKDGHIAGRSSTGKNFEHPNLVVNGVPKDLSPGNDDDQSVDGMNDADAVVGATFTRSGFHAYMLDSNGKHDLGVLPGESNSYAHAINSAGQIVGCSSNGSNRSCTAFIYENGHMKSLGRPPGMSGSDAAAINSAGTVVGKTYTTVGAGYAFIWTAATGIQDLNSFLPQGSKWKLQSADGINASGAIVGSGIINGSTHAFLLTPAA